MRSTVTFEQTIENVLLPTSAYAAATAHCAMKLALATDV